MSIEIKRRRGTTAQHAAFIGKEAELTVDTDKHTVVVHDGVTPGGHPLAHATDVGTAIDEALGALTAADVPTSDESTVQEKLDGVASQLAEIVEKGLHVVALSIDEDGYLVQEMADGKDNITFGVDADGYLEVEING